MTRALVTALHIVLAMVMPPGTVQALCQAAVLIISPVMLLVSVRALVPVMRPTLSLMLRIDS